MELCGQLGVKPCSGKVLLGIKSCYKIVADDFFSAWAARSKYTASVCGNKEYFSKYPSTTPSIRSFGLKPPREARSEYLRENY